MKKMFLDQALKCIKVSGNWKEKRITQENEGYHQLITDLVSP